MRFSLPFGPIEEEVRRKLDSMVAAPDVLIEAFLRELGGKLGPATMVTADRLVDRINGLPSVSPDHPSMRAYLAHPVRVAHSVLAAMTTPSADAVLTALLHNLFELSGLVEEELLQWGLSAPVVSRIRLLTIDRSRESDIAYLTGFYGAIEAAGEELALVRCMDKLDNLLGSQIVDNPGFRSEYIELADRFLTPMATRLNPSFGTYFGEACVFAWRAPYLPETKQQIDAFVKAEGALA